MKKHATQEQATIRRAWVQAGQDKGLTSTQMEKEYREKFGLGIKSLQRDIGINNKNYKPKFPAKAGLKAASKKGPRKTYAKRKAAYRRDTEVTQNQAARKRREYTKNNGEAQQLIDFLTLKGLNITKYVKEFKAVRKVFK